MTRPALGHAAAVILFALAVAAGPAPAATTLGRTVDIAAQHAGYAAGSESLESIHLHLQHVMNCLVGDGGGGYEQVPGDPCKGQVGAMEAASETHAQAVLSNAVELTRVGLAIGRPEPAKHVALAVQALLESVEVQ